MNKKNILFCLLIIIAIILTFISSNMISNMDKVDSKNSKKLLASNNLGTVTVEGPYGNKNSKEKIAFIIGVHPLESNSHEALLNLIRNKSKSLNHSYYIYIINVTKDKNDFDKGRLNGQLLSRENVVPYIISNNYTFVVDVHSHRSVYPEDNFILSPLNDKKSKEIGYKIIKGIKGMRILNFEPATDNSPSSPDYVTIPIIKNGTSSIIYETSLNESTNVTYNYLSQFIDNLDNFDF